MAKALKIVLWVIVALIVLVIVAVGIFLLSFNPNHYKGKISADFYQATGHPLVLKGDMHWSLYPTVGLTLTDVTVQNPAGYPQPVFAHFDSAQVSLRLLPLLSKHFEINRIVVDGLSLQLVQKTPLENNWNLVPPANPTRVAAVNTGMPPAAAPAPTQPMALDIGYLEVNNATIDYVNLQTQAHDQINHVVLSASQVNLSHPFPIALAFDMQSNQPQFSTHIGLQGNVTLDQQRQQYALRQLSLQMNGELVRPTFKIPLNFDLQGGVLVDLVRQELKAEATINVNNATILTQVEINQLQQSGMHYKGHMQLLPIDFDSILQGFGFAVPKFPSERALADSTFNIHFEGDRQHVVLDPLMLNLHRSKMTGRVEVTHFAQPTVDVKATIDQIPVEDYVHLHGAQLLLSNIQLMAHVSTQSLAMPALAQTLNGQAQLIVKQSTLKGLDIGAMLQHVNDAVNNIFQGGDILGGLATLQSQLPQFSPNMRIDPNNGQQTQFGYFNTQATIVNGVVNNTPVSLTGENFVVNGAGTVDLNKHILVNYHFNAGNAQLQKQANGQWVEVPGALKIPLYIQGPAEALTYGIDVSNLLSQLKTLALKRIQAQLQQAISSAPSTTASSGSQSAAPTATTSTSQVQQVQQKAQQLLQSVLGH